MKNHTLNPSPSRPGYRTGFALVVTLTLLILLSVLALGLVSLSTVSLRTSGTGADIATARANARMALMIAIGELQESMGPDQRVSAPASSVLTSPQRPHLTGVWNAWRWDPADSPTPDHSGKRDGFRRWLISSASPEDTTALSYASDSPEPESIEMIGNFEQDGIPTSVKAARVEISEPNRRGGYAWAVFDESVKAAVHLSPPRNERPPVEEVAARNAPDRFRPDIVSENLAPLEDARNLVTLETATVPVADDVEIHRRFHDLTAVSRGLLTDTASGGLKKDLSALFEAPSFPAAAFDQPNVFPASSGGISWKFLYDHYRKYKELAAVDQGIPRKTMRASRHSLSRTGVIESPDEEQLLPVIARMQIVFSIVSHHAHIGNRVNFLNQHGVPKGNEKHAVPHLAYDPVITLYNPYDVAISLDKVRVRIWDPPVGFRFIKKDVQKGTSAYLRPEMANGEFHGLARFGYQTDRNPSARKYFTLLLTEMGSIKPGSPITMEPGEVRVFSPWVNNDWTWGWETAGGYNVRAFFDYDGGRDFGNRDGRTSNPFGVEAVTGFDPRAGLQTDHLSYAARPPETLYDFEKTPQARSSDAVGGYPSLRLDDEIGVEIKPLRTLPPGSANPDFMVEILAGQVNDYNDSLDNKFSRPRDLLRRYKFSFEDATAEIAAQPQNPVISRFYRVGDTLQKPDEQGLGGKKCLAMLEMAAYTTKDPYDDTKPWLYNNPVITGADQNTAIVGAANQSYDLRLTELSGWTTFPIVEWNATPGEDYGKSYYGAGRTSSEGVSNVPMFHVPTAPAVSLGDLIPANLAAGSSLPRVVHPFGNSRAHPLVPSDKVSRVLDERLLPDRSYLLNDALWDSYFFSSIADYGSETGDGPRSALEVLEGVLDSTRPALNPRIVAAHPRNLMETPEELDAMDATERSAKIAAHLSVAGPFNLNSTSVEAWRSLLSSQRDRAISAWQKRRTENNESTPFVRTGFPLDAPSDSNNTVQGQPGWAAYRSLDDDQIKELARAIVSEIKKRGALDGAPSLTVAEFVNRRPGAPDQLHSLAGIIQSAIDVSGINAAQHDNNSRTLDASQIPAARKRGAVLPEAMDGFSAEGAPPIVTQGDILGPIAAVATVRGDTFKIRAYGESTSKDGKVMARAWCEAVVQRSPGFIDPSDPPHTSIASLSSTTNAVFGREFHIVSFRWIEKPES